MFFDDILLDLDDTLYDYNKCHKVAITSVINEIATLSNTDPNIVFRKYDNITKILKIELNNTASSHNRFIYFKLLLKELNIGVWMTPKIESIYWENFLKEMVPYDGVLDFLKYMKFNGIKIHIITDFTDKEQFNKIEKLGISKYIDNVFSSEEIGIEKPSEKFFSYVLNKVGTKKERIILIGNSLEKDINGGLNVGIYGFLKHGQSQRVILEQKCTIFDNFNSLLTFFINFKTELTQLEEISKYCGERFDLTQGAGGNISFKLDHLLCIKSSGIPLSKVSASEGYSIIKNDLLKSDVKTGIYNDLDQYNIILKNKASMETYMHSILKKYVVHLHPIQINKILVKQNYKSIIGTLFPNELLIDYVTPGIGLSKKINEEYKGENIIFLGNHGVIFTSDDYHGLIYLIESTIIMCENFLNENMEKYKNVTIISQIIESVTKKKVFTYLCDDSYIRQYISYEKLILPSFPDKSIFCGNVPYISGGLSINDFYNYLASGYEVPKILLINGVIYIVSTSLSNCRDIESILKAHLMLLENGNDIVVLNDEQVNILNNLDSEEYRKNIKI